MRLGILLSGRGSNLKAIHDAIYHHQLPATIVAVASDVPSCEGMAWAAEAGYPTMGMSPREFATKADFESVLCHFLMSNSVDWVILAGYMRLVGPTLLGAFTDRILNIHPSLLPLFKGLHPQQQALTAGVSESGCTVHLVTDQLDGGPILGQRSVPVYLTDTVATLSERILVEEHVLYPAMIRQLAMGSITIHNGVIQIQSKESL